MEKGHGHDEFHKLMDKYNFDSPVKVTLVIEEEESPEPVLLKTPLVSNNINVPNSNFCTNNSEVHKGRDSNIDDSKNINPNEKKNCNSQSVVEDNNHSISIINTDFPERNQEQIQGCNLVTRKNMEKVHGHDEFHKLMDKYNFDSPVKVTLVIEEEESPEPVLLKTPLVSNNINVPNSNFCTNNSEVHKGRDSNIDDSKNIKPNEKKNCNSQSVVEENNHSISIINTYFPERNQEKTQVIEWQLLDVVANNLIHITKYHYYNFENNNAKMANYKNLTNEYLTIKHHLFNLSYATTIAILIPRENDILFINFFIHRVITIANSISWFQITYKSLHTLIHEMLVWAKQKKHNLDIALDSHNYERHGMDWVSSGLSISNRLNDSSQVLNKPDNVHKTHLPEQELKLQNNNCCTTFNSQPELNIAPNLVQRTIHSNQETSTPLNTERRIDNSMQGISRLPFVDSMINKSTDTMSSINNNDPKTHNVSSCQAININTKRHLNEAYGTESVKRRKPNDGPYNTYSNSKSMLQHNDNNLNNKKNNCTATTFKAPFDGLCHEDSRKAEYELLYADTLRSSISRDSVVDSGSFRNKQTIETSKEQQTPIISNVFH